MVKKKKKKDKEEPSPDIDDIDIEEPEAVIIYDAVKDAIVLSDEEVEEYIRDIREHPVVKDLDRYTRTGDVMYHVIRSAEKEREKPVEVEVSEEELDKLSSILEKEFEKKLKEESEREK